jgi:WD40 repeat protein
MSSLFISYSRKDIDFARKLTEAVKGQQLDFWIDWEGIPPTVDWWEEIETGIEEADVFVFLISPDSSSSDVCRREIEHAVKNGKRLIPLVIRDIKAETAPRQLSALNWIFLRASDDFETSFGTLMSAIRTDYEWVQVHRQLQVKALEWERNHSETSFLLRGRELQDAEVQLVANALKEPQPTELQRKYVLNSRQEVDRQRRRTTVITTIAGIVLAALAVVAVIQAGRATSNFNEAQKQSSTAQAASTLAYDNAQTADANAQLALKQSKISRANELAAQSVVSRESDLQLSSLLAIEAFKSSDTVQSRGALMESLRAKPQARYYLSGQKSPVEGVAFDPSGSLLATGSQEGPIILWDLHTHHTIGNPLQGHTADVHALAFSPDGKVLVSGSFDNSIRFWNVSTGAPIGSPLTEHTSPVVSIAFSPDGGTVASGGSDGVISLWDAQTHSFLAELVTGTDSSVESLAFSPNGNLLASAAGTTVTLWDMQTRELAAAPIEHGASVSSVAFRPDGRMIAFGSSDTTVTLWDVEQQYQVFSSAVGLTGAVNCIAFSPDGKTLVSGSDDGSIFLHDMNLEDPYGGRLLGRNVGGVYSLAVSPDGLSVTTNGDENNAIVWSMQEDQLFDHKLDWSDDMPVSVTFSPDGKTLVAGYFHGTGIIWDTTTHQQIGSPIHVETIGLSSVEYVQGGKMLVFHNYAGGIDMLWNLSRQKPVINPLNGYNMLDISDDGHMLALGDENETIILWDLEKGKAIGQPLTSSLYPVLSTDGSRLIYKTDEGYFLLNIQTGKKENITALYATILSFSHDGKIVAVNDTGAGTVTLWDVGTQTQLGNPFDQYEYWISSTAFSPDDRTLAISVDYGTIYLWDVAMGQLIGLPLRSSAYSAYQITFSPDGRLLASGMQDDTIILWDLATHQPIGQPLPGFQVMFKGLRFSPDGKTLAAIGDDSKVTLWDVDPASWIEKTCARVGRNLTQDEWTRYFPDEDYHATCPEWPSKPEIISTPQPLG